MSESRAPRFGWQGFGALALALGALGLFLLIARHRHPLASFTGDEGTYVAMAQSLARDGDLRFGEADRLWAEGHAGGPVTLILQRSAAGIAYSKPILYPLLAAPFVWLAGEHGLWIVNVVAVGLALLLGWEFLRRFATSGAAALTLVTFAAASTIVPQLVWRMTESVQLALALAGLVLALAWARPRAAEAERPGWLGRLLDAPAAPWIGAVLLGLLASLRDPNLGFALLPAASAALARRWGRALGLAAVALASFAALLALTWQLTGTANPYRAERASFGAESGYPEGADADRALGLFEAQAATQTLELAAAPDSRRAAYSGLYFLVGRHTGMLVYFPALVALLPAALRRPDRFSALLLAAAFAYAAFYVVWMPDNYFGGEGFLGNRYYFAALPLFLVALRRPIGWPLALPAWLVAAAVGGSALLSVQDFSVREPSTQNHAYAGVFRQLPYETTAAAVAGRRDRYWSNDFLRFVDPFAEVGDWDFALRAGEPRAEVVLASWWPRPRVTLLAVCKCSAGGWLEVRDFRGLRRYRLEGAASGVARSTVEVELRTPWRRHPFWWEPGNPYNIWVLRLGLRTDDGASATVHLRYLGDGGVLALSPARDVQLARLPARAVAGSQSEIPLRLRNLGELVWTSEAPLPVTLGWRLTPLDGGATSEGRTPLRRPVVTKGFLTQPVAVDWPKEPGRYRLVVDLVAEDLAWFGERVGAPVAEGIVEVTAPPSR